MDIARNPYEQQYAQQMPPQPPQPGAGMPPPMARPNPLDDPRVLATILGRSQTGLQNTIEQQRALAKMMRADAQGQLQGVQAGKTYRAPGLANLGASLFASYNAGEADREAQRKAEALDAAAQAQAEGWYQQANRR